MTIKFSTATSPPRSGRNMRPADINLLRDAAAAHLVYAAPQASLGCITADPQFRAVQAAQGGVTIEGGGPRRTATLIPQTSIYTHHVERADGPTEVVAYGLSTSLYAQTPEQMQILDRNIQDASLVYDEGVADLSLGVSDFALYEEHTRKLERNWALYVGAAMGNYTIGAQIDLEDRGPGNPDNQSPSIYDIAGGTWTGIGADTLMSPARPALQSREFSSTLAGPDVDSNFHRLYRFSLSFDDEQWIYMHTGGAAFAFRGEG